MFLLCLIVENAEVKFKDFMVAMKTMLFTEEEALCLVELLKEKSNVIQDILQKVSLTLRLEISLV